MRIQHIPMMSRLNLRRFLAVAFMVVLLAEWGSHTFNHHAPEELLPARGGYSMDIPPSGTLVDTDLADHGHHEDHCPTMICNDSGRHDQQVPNTGHQITPTHGVFEGFEFRLRLDELNDTPLPYRVAHRLYGPPLSTFHPPELS